MSVDLRPMDGSCDAPQQVPTGASQQPNLKPATQGTQAGHGDRDSVRHRQRLKPRQSHLVCSCNKGFQFAGAGRGPGSELCPARSEAKLEMPANLIQLY